MSKIKNIIKKIKHVKHIEIYFAIGAVVIMLMIYFVNFTGNKQTPKKNELVDVNGIYSNYCDKMQHELKEYVTKIDGAGATSVVINWESSVELILAATINNSTNSNSSSPTIIDIGGNSQPIILKEIYPKAVGVVIVCEGGNNAKVKVNIILSISTLLNIPSEQVIVLASRNK